MLGEDCHIGKEFPAGNILADILLLVLSEVQQKIRGGLWKTENDETCVVSNLEFERIVVKVKRDFASGFAKKYREMPDGEFVRVIIEEMERWTFIRTYKETRQVRIYPAAGKLRGSYPKDFTDKMDQTGEEREEMA